MINNMAKNIFGLLQRIGKALMLPVALLPAAGILMGIGTIFKNPDIISNFNFLSSHPILVISNILCSAGSIVFNNLPLIFAVGVAIGLSDGDGVAALSAIVGFLIMNMTMSVILGVSENLVINSPMYGMILGIPTLQTGVFGGILIGIVSAFLYNKFYNIKLPEFLGFFSGKRFVPIITSIVGLILGILMVIIWPPIQRGLFEFSRSMIHANETLSSLIFGIVERGLIPFGLHHIWYNPFWYQFGEYIDLSGNLIIGDQAIFFAQLKDGVDFTAGTFMTGKYPFMMFGLPAAALAMYHEANEFKKKNVAGILFSAALTSFLTGITEPIEFMFLFVAPALFGIHCVLAGLSFMIMQILNIKIGVTFSGGLIDFILLGVLPNRSKWYLVILVGMAFAIIYYIGFRVIIRKLDLNTPGREAVEENVEIDISDGMLAHNVLGCFGGRDNIKYLDACITRLRVTVLEKKKVDCAKIKSLGAAGIMTIGENIQCIFGPKSDMLKEQIKDVIEGREIKGIKKKKIEEIIEGKNLNKEIAVPVDGEMVRLEEVPDDIFAMKLIGDGVAIKPTTNIVKSPISGEITALLPTKHAITIKAEDGLVVFIHIGIDTIKLKGEGFESFVKIGDRVKIGDELIKFEETIMNSKVKSKIIPIIFKNLGKNKYIYFEQKTKVKAGQIDKIQIHER